MSIVRRILNSKHILLNESSAVEQALSHVVANVEADSPSEIERCVDDAVNRFKVDRDELEIALVKRLESEDQK